MNQLEKIQISDCTLLDAADHAELSFREKIELCRLIDKLGVSTIDLCGIRQKKIDRLLIKSICSAVKNAMIAVPVSLIEEESVQMTWEALREARSARLQVVAPVSSVQMEYLLIKGKLPANNWLRMHGYPMVRRCGFHRRKHR